MINQYSISRVSPIVKIGIIMSFKKKDFFPSLENLIKDAPRSKPKDLGVLEPELRRPCPRPDIWVHIYTVNKALRDWQAVRGWICFFHEQMGDPEGPDYYYAYAWESDNGICITTEITSHDQTHWIINSRGDYQWFKETIKLGNPVTILTPPANASKEAQACLYGRCDPVIDVSGSDLFEFLQAEIDPVHRAGIIDCIGDILLDLALSNPDAISALVRGMNEHGEIFQYKQAVDVAKELRSNLKQHGRDMPGLAEMMTHLKVRRVKRFAAV
jgi:hypothetical protein